MVALLQSEFPAILEFEWGNFQHAILHFLQAESCVHIGGLNSPASQPTASVFKGSTGKETSSVRWQVLHSKVRRSNPRWPGEIRPKPILCLQVGHIGRSTVENEVRISRHPSARICIAETRGLSGVRLSVKFNLAAAPHLSNGRYRARLDRAAGNPGTKVGVQLQSNHARIKSMNRKAEEASEGQRKTVVILSDR